MSDITWYMATGEKNQTGPICKDPGKAARGFFQMYKDETKCYINAGDRLNGTDLFFAKVGITQFELRREDVFC